MKSIQVSSSGFRGLGQGKASARLWISEACQVFFAPGTGLGFCSGWGFRVLGFGVEMCKPFGTPDHVYLQGEHRLC